MRFARLTTAVTVTISALLCAGAFVAPARSTPIVQSAGFRPLSAPPNVDGRIGIDVDPLQQSSDVIFTDVMKQAAPWTSDRQLIVGEDGYVQRLASNQTAHTVTLQSAVYPSGDYLLLWDGRGTLQIDPQSGSMTAAGNGRAILHVVARLGYGIRLRLTATDARNYVRNLRLIAPGFATTYQTTVFAPAYLARLSAFHVVRFVHWSQADTLASSATWPARPMAQRFTQAGPAGAALEYQIALANAAGVNPWFVIPAGATNFYIAQTAALVRARLDPRLRPAFEYASGAWRPGAPANLYATMAGRNFKLATDAQAAALAWYGRRSAQMFGIVQAVYGPDAARITRVLGGVLALRNTPADAVDRTILANARTPQGVADLFAVDAATPAPAAIAYTHSMLSTYGLSELAAAEGAGAFAGAANAAVIRSGLDAWHAAGGGLFVGSAVSAYSANAQAAALISYSRTHPSVHVAPAPQAAVEPAPDTIATAFIPPSAAAPAIAAEAAAARAHAAALKAADSTLGIDIDSGGAAASPWVADVDFTGGAASQGTTKAIDTTGVTNPAPQSVYQTSRYGTSFSYLIPGLTPGSAYTVRLHFAEYYYSASGQRLGNYAINSVPVLTNFDIFAAAGAKKKAVVEQFNATPTSAGTISITVTGVHTASTTNAQINGIEISANGTGPTPTPTPTPSPTTAPSGTVDVPQYHNDALRTGWNPTETTLNTTNVASSKFQLLRTLPVDGLVMAQPLYIADYPVAADSGHHHNLLIVATENDSVYAFDADNGTQLWRVPLGIAQSAVDVGCPQIVPTLGINSTPAIDRGKGEIYVVAATEPSTGVFQQYLHAIDLGSGSDKRSTLIAATNVMTNGSNISFDPLNNMQRAAILLANNSVYLGFGSHCDHANKTISGWLLRYSTSFASSAPPLAAFNTIEDPVITGSGVQMAAIWGAGFGPAADAQGNVYTVTGNGRLDAQTAGGRDYAMSVIKLRPDLSGGVLDWFAYSNEVADNHVDLDFGSGGAMLLPRQSTGVPNTLIVMGKSGIMYLLNQANLGHLTSNDAGALSILSGHNGMWGGPAFFQGPAGPTIYYQTNGDVMRAYTVNGNGGKSTLSAVPAIGNTTTSYGGTIPVVSSSGQTSGTAIVWTLRHTKPGTTNAYTTLDAYDASNLTKHLFAGRAGTWSSTSDGEFVTPLVANGKVYAGANQTVTIFGLGP